MNQLPLDVQLRIFTDFVHRQFIQTFRRFFMIKKSKFARSFFTDKNLKKYKLIERDCLELSQGKRHFKDIRLIGLEYPYFTFHDKEYADFMNMVLQGLEDRTYQKGDELIEELQECYEVRFVQEGTFDVGFEVNRKKYYKLRFGKSAIIGGYQICFRSRYLFTYKASSLLKTYSLRLRMWTKIM